MHASSCTASFVQACHIHHTSCLFPSASHRFTSLETGVRALVWRRQACICRHLKIVVPVGSVALGHGGTHALRHTPPSYDRAWSIECLEQHPCHCPHHPHALHTRKPYMPNRGIGGRSNRFRYVSRSQMHLLAVTSSTVAVRRRASPEMQRQWSNTWVEHAS